MTRPSPRDEGHALLLLRGLLSTALCGVPGWRPSQAPLPFFVASKPYLAAAVAGVVRVVVGRGLLGSSGTDIGAQILRHRDRGRSVGGSVHVWWLFCEQKGREGGTNKGPKGE